MRRMATAAALVLLGVAGGVGAGARPLAAQYFGQNKVQYRTFDFKVIQTEHFEVYYYDRERAAALDAARMAERGYARLSRVLDHQFQGRKPIILYASQSDFQQTNVIRGDLGEGTGGVTEFFKHRMVLPFTGSYAELEHVLQHEMVHQFQYDVYSRGRIGSGLQTIVTVNPPLWFVEGMAEYLSVGPIDPHTTMWLRDAALEGNLPTIEQLTVDPRIFPYRFGHALWAYIGEKWGDEVIGEILQASISGGIEGAFQRALGVGLEEVSADWRDAVQTTFLPQIGDHYRARRIAQPVLTQRRSEGTLHLAPALSPDGRRIAYFSERSSFFVDLYLADAETGRVQQRLVKSSINANYESLRFINSSGSFSPDGSAFAIAAKHKDRDDLVIIDVKRRNEERRIPIPLNGLTTPAWSPDGRQLVFTGYDGGLSDLFIVNRDGSGLRRLTEDKYADFQPVWSPDGKTIAFATDRGPDTDFSALRFGNMRIALYHLDSGTIELLGRMDHGKNINPVWAPDGKSLVFVSDRTGISNLFLYDLTDGSLYRLTDFFTGTSGITPLSPALSWARQADRLAFAYYEDGDYNVYAMDNPRSLRRQPYQEPAAPVVTSLLAVARRDTAPSPAAATPTPTPGQEPREGLSVYRSPSGFRASGAAPQAAESTATASPVSVRSLLDSASLALPDTSEFSFRPYRARFTPDNMVRPTIGYERDNFGRGFFGGTAITLSDILGNQTLVLSAAINGRLTEAQVLFAYINQTHRLNWAAGVSQDPLYFYAPSTVRRIVSGRDSGRIEFTSRLRRFVIRNAFVEAYYPFNRFRRVELGLRVVNLTDDTLTLQRLSDPTGRFITSSNFQTGNGVSTSYVQPSVALVHDKSLFGYVGPFAGTRSRFQFAPSIGAWRFYSGIGDYRRYLFARPFTLAFRTMFYGRWGRDADRFPLFLGSTELIRGYTAGSFRNNECAGAIPSTSTFSTGCAELDQLIGSQLVVGNVELRFPLARNVLLGLLPISLPPIEGAIFYDVGVAFDNSTQLVWSRTAGQNPVDYRQPLRSLGGSIRANLLGVVVLRLDYTKPLDRTRRNAYWTVSLGPTF